MNYRKIIGILFFVFIFSTLFAQIPVAVGEWRTHFNYTHGNHIATIKENTFLATKNTLFYINLFEKRIQRLGKLEGLNDIGIQTIEASEKTNTLIICYLSSNIDLYSDGFIFNIPDIEKKQISGDKTIYSIHCEDTYAYLACGFGIVIIDLKKKLIKDTWFFQKDGQSIAVNDLAIFRDTVFAATPKGIFYNNINNVSIAQFSTWYQVQADSLLNRNIEFIQEFENELFAFVPTLTYKIDTIYNTDSTFFELDSSQTQKINIVYSFENGIWNIDSTFGFEEVKSVRNTHKKLVVTRGWGAHAYEKINGNIILNNVFSSHNAQDAVSNEWGYLLIADQQQGLVCQEAEGAVVYSLPGPASDDIWKISMANSTLVAVPGAHVDWTPLWRQTNISIFENEKWKNLLYYDDALAQYPSHDALDVLFNPNTQELFLASYLSGLVHIKNGKVEKIYNEDNSPLRKYADRVPVNSLAFDKDYNVWMINSNAPNPLLVRTKDGKWQSFNIYHASNDVIGKLYIDSRGWIWMTADRETSLLIYDPKGTPLAASDDRLVKLNTALSEEEGAFNFIYSIAEDKDGNMWIGTNKGIKIYYNPSALFDNPNILPNPIKIIEQLGDTSVPQLLLNQEIIKCIKIDGGNRKWIGTDNAGVFLESSDGKTEILHFTTENSPLLSNTINDIDIDETTGEVFIATDKGLVSFRYTATEGKENYEAIKIFPNPVREDFTGYISITGLKENSEVKITDVAGGLVYRIKSEGGTATWNGRRFDGSKASTGVYFVFVSDKTGKEKKAGKLLFIK